MRRPLPSDQTPWRASARPSAGVAPPAQPPPRPRVAERDPPLARPPNRQPLSASAGLLPRRGAPRRGMLGTPPPPGAAPFSVPRRPRLGRARGGGGPRAAAPGSCLRSPRRPGLLPLRPAPPPGAGICALPGPGASPPPPALRHQRVSASRRRARALRPAGDPRAPPTRRAPRAREPGAPGAWDPAEPLPSPRGSAGMQAAL